MAAQEIVALLERVQIPLATPKETTLTTFADTLLRPATVCSNSKGGFVSVY